VVGSFRLLLLIGSDLEAKRQVEEADDRCQVAGESG